MKKKIFDIKVYAEIMRFCRQVSNAKTGMDGVGDFMQSLMKRYEKNDFVKGLYNLKFQDYTSEEQAYLFFHCDHILYEGLVPFNDEKIKHQDCYEDLKIGKEGLLRKGVVMYHSLRTDNMEKVATRSDNTMLSPHAVHELFYGYSDLISISSIARQATIIHSDSILKKELFFDERMQEEVQRVEKVLCPKTFESIIQRLEKRGRRKSATFLFHGAPGTGKTELVKQLALKTGRNLVIVDVAKLHSSFTGDTEKNYRELFQTYRYMVQVYPNVPILLFNEADGVLSKRGDVLRQAVDKIANRIQNLLLQELEDFEGILIATTNLVENFDSAFDRRFLFKVKFNRPDKETQVYIWKSLLPELNKNTIRKLVSRFDFSGAQIENIANKYDIDEILDGVAPTYEKMVKYCESEKIISDEKEKTDSDSSKIECLSDLKLYSCSGGAGDLN